jgi:hypothetical protein
MGHTMLVVCLEVGKAIPFENDTGVVVWRPRVLGRGWEGYRPR